MHFFTVLLTQQAQLLREVWFLGAPAAMESPINFPVGLFFFF